MSRTGSRTAFVCTAHIASEPLWSSVQPRYLRKHLPGAVLVAAVERESDDLDYDRLELLEGEHRNKLDQLARLTLDEMSTDERDILVFLDGDAFPVRALASPIEEMLRATPLAAICRAENDEDYPHPSFCVTTVGFWRRIGGTWETSDDPSAPVNELGGGRLRDLLAEHGIEWRRLLRSNRFDPHPVLFGVYGGLVYHHGAGFRRPVTEADRLRCGQAPGNPSSPRDDRLLEEIACRNEAMSSTFKRLIKRFADFHEVLEEP